MGAILHDPLLLEPRMRLPNLVRWVVLSLVLQSLVITWSPRLRKQIDEKPEPPSMTVTLRPSPQPPVPQAALAPPPAPAAITPPRQAKNAPRETKPREVKEPVIALAKPAPAAPAIPVTPPTPQPTEAPAPVTPQVTAPLPPETDLAAYVEARRRARGEGVDPAASEAERANRGAVANAALKPSAPLNFESKKPTANSGWFRIDRRGTDYAQFTFFGWNESFGRNWLQQIDVKKGDNSTIDIAVVRSIIEIIRRYENGDFKWYSKRTGRTFTLSARARDNAGLEEFLMQEFYDDLHRYR
jgi:outer membrane biosynthesis protein TonB